MSSIPSQDTPVLPQNSSPMARVEPKMADERDSTEQKAYAMARLAGQNAPEARKMAMATTGKKVPRSHFNKHGYSLAVREIMDSVGLDAEYRIRRLKQLIESDQGREALGALKEAFRLADDYPTEKKAIIHTSLSEYKELMVEAEQIREELAELESKTEPTPVLPGAAQVEGEAPREEQCSPKSFSFGCLPDGFRSSI